MWSAVCFTTPLTLTGCHCVGAHVLQEKAELFGEILADLQDMYVEPVDVDKLAETGYQVCTSGSTPLRQHCVAAGTHL